MDRPPGPLVIIPCGGKKRRQYCAAGNMYTGPYFRMCLRFAAALTDYNRVLILSAKYGLLALEDPIHPYELRMGGKGCVTAAQVRVQAKERGVLEEPKVIALGGRDYIAVCRTVWPNCFTPLSGVGGIGKQLGWMKEHLDRGYVDAAS